MDIKIKLYDGAELPVIRKGNCADIKSMQVGLIKKHLIGESLSFNDPCIMWYNTDSSSSIKVEEGDVFIVETGIAMCMPENWFNYAYPRSSNFLKYGIILTNSVGIIDHEYKGNHDTWKGVFYCTRKSVIDITKPLLQFTPVKDTIHDFNFVVVDDLDNDSRGGFGSTDK